MPDEPLISERENEPDEPEIYLEIVDKLPTGSIWRKTDFIVDEEVELA